MMNSRKEAFETILSFIAGGVIVFLLYANWNSGRQVRRMQQERSDYVAFTALIVNAHQERRQDLISLQLLEPKANTEVVNIVRRYGSRKASRYVELLRGLASKEVRNVIVTSRAINTLVKATGLTGEELEKSLE